MISTFEFADNVAGILIKEDLTSEIMEQVHQLILEQVNFDEKINLYVEIEDGLHVSMPAFFKDVTFKFKNSAKFNKIAVVTNLDWFQNMMEIKDLLMDADVKSFTIENRLKAISWIAE
jgi:hypothetical protein